MVYLLCFHRAHRHARHYLGWTQDIHTLERRLHCHQIGKGAKLTHAVRQAGNGWTVVRLWEGDRALERLLHNRKNSAKLCPICNPDHWMKQAAQQTIYPSQTEEIHHEVFFTCS